MYLIRALIRVPADELVPWSEPKFSADGCADDGDGAARIGGGDVIKGLGGHVSAVGAPDAQRGE